MYVSRKNWLSYKFKQHFAQGEKVNFFLLGCRLCRQRSSFFIIPFQKLDLPCQRLRQTLPNTRYKKYPVTFLIQSFFLQTIASWILIGEAIFTLAELQLSNPTAVFDEAIITLKSLHSLTYYRIWKRSILARVIVSKYYVFDSIGWYLTKR